MPIPNPRFDEQQKEYVSRCYAAIKNEYPDPQAFSICYSKWKEKKMVAIAKLKRQKRTQG